MCDEFTCIFKQYKLRPGLCTMMRAVMVMRNLMFLKLACKGQAEWAQTHLYPHGESCQLGD